MKMLRLALLSVVSSVASSTEVFRKSGSALPITRRLDEDADDDDMSWMKGYSVAYANCFYTDQTVNFLLCPADNSCKKGCDGGGEYLVDLAFFVDAFTEAQMNAREYICEQVRENCDDDDEDSCYENAGLDYCSEKDEDEFNLQEYLECKELDDGDYYVGPYCASDSESIYLGLFTDEDCTALADEGIYNDLYGYDLPYSSESIISDTCARCKEHAMDEHQDYGDQEDEDDVLEQCEDLYTEASKCEGNMDVDEPEDDGCNYIEQLKETEQVSSGSSGSSSSRRGLIWGFVIAALVVGSLVGCWLFARNKKKKNAELTPAKENLI